MRFRSLGLILLLAAAGAAWAGVDQKKAYELIYQDVQLLKQQLLKVEAKVDKAGEDLRTLGDQVRDIQAQLRLSQADQAGLKEDVRKLPSQFQALLAKLEQVTQAVNRISEEFLAVRAQLPPPAAEPSAVKPAAKDPARDAKPKKKEEAARETPSASQPVNPNLAPKDVFDMAYADYTKGNYELAVEGFKIYRQQFFDSPLADDALYWIGECAFSLKKYAEAIEQFNLLIFNYPQGNNIPAAYLKKGMCFIELGKRDEALSVFKLLISKYPNDEETKIAQEKIKELTSGHERH